MFSTFLTHLTSYIKNYTQDLMSCVESSGNASSTHSYNKNASLSLALPLLFFFVPSQLWYSTNYYSTWLVFPTVPYFTSSKYLNKTVIERACSPWKYPDEELKRKTIPYAPYRYLYVHTCVHISPASAESKEFICSLKDQTLEQKLMETSVTTMQTTALKLSFW